MSVTLLSSGFQQVHVQGFPLLSGQGDTLRGEILAVDTHPGVPVDYRLLAAKHPVVRFHLDSIQCEVLLFWIICGKLDHHVVISGEIALGHRELTLENIRPVSILVELHSLWVSVF